MFSSHNLFCPLFNKHIALNSISKCTCRYFVSDSLSLVTVLSAFQYNNLLRSVLCSSISGNDSLDGRNKSNLCHPCEIAMALCEMFYTRDSVIIPT